MMLRSIAICILLLSVLESNSAELLRTPQNLQAAVQESLLLCQKKAATPTPTGNQLMTDGLKSCFYQAKQELTENIERAVAKIDLIENKDCRNLSAQLDEKWSKYSEKALKVPSLGAMPVNTDDDLEVILLGNRYQIIYSIINNFGCRT